MRTALHTAALAIWDTTFIVAAALILWHNAGDLVTTGSLAGQLGCFAALTTGVSVHILLLRILAPGQHPDPRVVMWTQFTHLAILAAATTAWILLQDYFLGWVITFGAFVAAVAGAWQLIAAIVTSSPADPERRATARRRPTAPWPFAVSTLVSVAIIAVLHPIHAWNLSIINPVAVQASGSLLLGILVAAWITRRPTPRTATT